MFKNLFFAFFRGAYDNTMNKMFRESVTGVVRQYLVTYYLIGVAPVSALIIFPSFKCITTMTASLVPSGNESKSCCTNISWFS